MRFTNSFCTGLAAKLSLKTVKRLIYRKIAIATKNVRVGRNFHVGPLTRIWAPNLMQIGDDVYIGKYVTIEVDGRIGSGSLIANSVGIVGRKDHHIHEIGVPISKSKWVGQDSDQISSVFIGKDVWIGFGAIILGPVKIGDSAIVAAGAVVTKDVKEFEIVAGNPAQHLSYRFKGRETRAYHQKMISQEYSKNES